MPELPDERQTNSPMGGEHYSFGYGSAINILANRSAAQYAAFFTPYLKPGMTVLDCGCSPRYGIFSCIPLRFSAATS